MPNVFTEPTIERLDPSNVEISWVGTNPAAVRIYRDGTLLYGPLTTATATKLATVPWDTDEPVQWEATEDADGVGTYPPPVRPTLHWYDPNATAEFWRIYHREGSGGNVVHLADAAIEPDGTGHYSWKVPTDLNGVDGVWHWFKVLAIDANGLESSHALWYALIRDLPTGPSNMTAAQTAPNTITLTITE